MLLLVANTAGMLLLALAATGCSSCWLRALAGMLLLAAGISGHAAAAAGM